VAYYGQAGFRHLLMSGVYEKFPKLKHILTESGCYWVPAILKQCDRAYYSLKSGSLGEMNYKGMESP
jgi:predicted TIM-barrel fold metal-dependent hydrolase